MSTTKCVIMTDHLECRMTHDSWQLSEFLGLDVGLGFRNERLRIIGVRVRVGG